MYYRFNKTVIHKYQEMLGQNCFWVANYCEISHILCISCFLHCIYYRLFICIIYESQFAYVLVRLLVLAEAYNCVSLFMCMTQHHLRIVIYSSSLLDSWQRASSNFICCNVCVLAYTCI